MKRALDVRSGNLLLISGRIFKVEEVDIKGSAKMHKTISFKIRDILDGKSTERTYHQDDKLDEANVVRKKAAYSYKDSNKFCFLDEETYETYEIDKDIVGNKEVFLKENEKYTVDLYENKPIDVVFPERIRLKVVTAPPGIKQHDSMPAKQVTLENGMVIDAPQFIAEGDIVEVDSHTGKYVDRIQE